jgi:SnoaL-like protein
MDEEVARAALRRYIDHSGVDPDIAHEIYHDDAVLEFPQSGERFEGVENFREWRRIYPAKVEFDLRRIRGRDDLWVMELRGRYDGGPWNYGVSILEFRGDKVAHETIYGGEAWEAPEWRAPWRATGPA